MRRSRTAVLWIAAALLLMLVLGTLAVLVHPILLTGQFYDITIRAVDQGPEGRVTMTYDEALTYDTWVTWMYDVPRGIKATSTSWNSWHGGGGRRFLRWPRREREQTLTFFLTSAEERDGGIADSPELRRRWVLEKGHYRIRPGERLVLYRRVWPSGKVFESTIEVTVSP